ncbi:GNAT family N-acetyltransferase [Streptomyces sp. NPDC019531]|uniref:GNAT family N-acetyltransferase n=1 Tax=Streptomyces sp. NPDC019531 TaxID=3365062 RepID=UPI00384DBCE9
MPPWTVQAARPAELTALHSLLTDTCEPQDIPATALLAQAVDRGLALVAVSDGVPVGCVAAEMPSPGHARLTVVAVRQEARRQGAAAQLLAEMLRVLLRKSDEPPLISVIARTEQLTLTRLLLASGFIGTRVLRLPGLHVHYQYKSRVEYIDPEARHLVPVSAREQLVESLSPSDHAVTALVTLGGEPAFEIARFEKDDPAALQSGEAAAGIAFSGSILAAVTFLLGFAFSSTRFPDDVRLLLIGATFATVLSLIIYASASGELARLRSNSFGRIMKWGNVLSEYGGVLPFLISLPVTYAQASGDPWTTMVLAVVLSLAIGWYERSEFSIAHRFRRSRTELALKLFTAASPTIGAALVAADATSWPWTIALITALTARTWLYLFRRGAEADVAERRQWRIRA